MADNEIRVVITGVAEDLRKALDGAKGDLGGLKAAIRDVPDKIKVDVDLATVEAAARLDELQARLGRMPDKISIGVDLDDGVAKARLDLLNAKVRETERQVARASLGAGFASGGGGGGGFGSSVAGSLGSGGLPGAAPLAIGTAAAPLIAALVGSLTAIVSSAGAAILGAGALGTSALGAGGVGIGAMLPVLLQAKAGITAVTTAMGALETAQDDYGKRSLQAKQAQVNLNGAIADAGPLAAQIATDLSDLGDRWKALAKPATNALYGIILPGLNVVKALMPTVAGIAKQSFDAIGAALRPVFAGLSSPAFKKVLTDLGDAFAKLIGPGIAAGASLMRAFFSVAVAAAPYLIQIAQAFERWAGSFADSLAPGQHLNDLIKGLVGQLHSWWDLAKALGGLMVTVFKAGADTGQQLVEKLTVLLTKWNAWLNTAAGQAAMKKFFSDSASLLAGVLGALKPVVELIASMSIGLIPTMTTLLRPLAELLTTISKWVNGLSKELPPVLNALPGLAVAIGVLASWKALQAVVSATVAMMLRGVGLGGAGAAAGAGGVTAAEAGAGAGGLIETLGPALAVALPAALVVALETGGPQKGKAQPGLASALGPLGATKTTSNILDRINPFDGSGFLGLGAAQTSTQSKPTTADLKALADGLKGIVSPAQLSTGQLEKLRAEIGKLLMQKDLTAVQRDGLIKTERLLETGGGPISAITKFGEVWARTFQGIAATTGSVFAQVKTTLATDLQNISTNLGTGTKPGQQALVGSLSGALQTILDNTSAAVRGTAKGIKAINDALDASLLALGASKSAIKTLGPVVSAEVFTGFTLPTGPLGKATGGLIQIGQPGERGRDTVGMSVGGHSIAVGAGEQVAVFNHDQQRVMNARLADMGGLGGMFSRHNRPHYMAGGGFVPGFAAGGALSFGQLEGLWEEGGGPAGVAPTAAAIALAESGGRDVVQQGQPFAETGWGPWQITPGGPQFLNLLTNAREAVAKYKAAGNTFRPWTTFEDGAFRQFMHGNVPAIGGAFSALSTPAVGGTGALSDIVRSSLKLDTSAANQYLAKLAGASGAVASAASGAGVPGVGRGGFSGAALGSFQGLQVAKWIIPELLYAQAHGWKGRITSGYRSGFDPMAPSGSEHAQDIYPGGAVDFGGMVSPAALANKDAFFAASAGYPSAQKLIAPIGFRDDGHASGTGHARGGVPGGLVAHKASSAPPKKAAPKHPTTPKVHVPKTISDALARLLPASVVGLDTVAGKYAQSQVDLSTADAQLTYTQGLAPYPAQPLVTLTDADVAAMDPTGSLGYETGDELVNQSGMTVGRFFGPNGVQGGSFAPGIDQRQTQISAQLTNLYAQKAALVGKHSAGGFYGAAIKAEIKAKSQRETRRKRVLAFLRKQVVKAQAIQAELAAITSGNLKQNLSNALSRQSIAGRVSGLTADRVTVSQELSAEKTSQSQLPQLERDPAHTEYLQGQLGQINQSLAVEHRLSSGGGASVAVQAAKSAILKNDLTARLAAYAKVDTELGGSKYTVGTTGVIGTLQKQMDAIDAQRVSDQGSKAALAPTLQQIANTIQSYIVEQKGLPGTSAVQVRTPGASTATDSTLNSLLTEQLGFAQTDLATSQAQFGVLAGFAPLLQGRLLGSLQSGIGFVPQTGPYLLHRGESVVPDPVGPAGSSTSAATVQTAQGPVQITLNFQNNSPPLVKLITATMNQKALQIVNDKGGQRARLMAGVRRPS